MSVEQKTLPKSVQVEKSSSGEYKIRMPLWVYRTIGLVLLLGMLVACGEISVEPAAVDVQPTATTTNIESVPTEASEDGAGDPPEDEEMVEVTITVPAEDAQPTDAPPTAAPEMDPTREAIERFAGFSALSAEDKSALDEWARSINLGGLGSPESFLALNGYQLRVIGAFGPENTYQPIDIIQRMAGGEGYFPVTAKALDAEGNEVEITPDFTLTNGENSSRFILEHGVTPLYWNAPTGERFRFDYVTEEFYPENVYDELIEVREANAAGFDNVVSSEYDDVTGLTYGLDANGTRVAVEDETGWKAYEAPIEGTDYSYGPDGESVNTLEGEPMPDSAHTFTFSIRNGWQQGFNLNIPNGISPITPDAFFSSMEADSVINAPQAIVNLEESIGQNGTIDSLMASVILGYGQEYYANAGMTFNFVYRQTFFRGSNGELYMLIWQDPTHTIMDNNSYPESRNVQYSTGLDANGFLNIQSSNQTGAPYIPGYREDGDPSTTAPEGVEGLYRVFTQDRVSQGQLPAISYIFFSNALQGDTTMVRQFGNEPSGGFDPDKVLSFQSWAIPPGNGLGYTTQPIVR